MFRPLYAAPLASLALVLNAPLAQAQTPAHAPARPGAPPAAAPANAPQPTLAPPAAPPGATGPDAPVSKTTSALEEKLAAMQRGNGLTSDEAARRSVSASANITEKQHSIEAANATVDQVSAALYPQLTLSARYTRLSPIHLPDLSFGPGTKPIPADSIFPVYLNNYDLRATLNVPLSDYVLRTSGAIAAAKHNKTSADLDRRATELSVARDARVAYYQWIRAQGAYFVAEQALEAARGHLVDAKNSFQAGLSSKADVLRAESQVKSSELTAQRFTDNVAIATEQLRVMMGDGPEANYEIGENILIDPAPFATPPSTNSAYAEAIEHRVEVRQLGESEASLRQQASALRAADYPRLDAQANAYDSRPNQRYIPPLDAFKPGWDVGVTLSWTPTNIFGTEAQHAATLAQADVLASKKVELKNGLRIEVYQAMNALNEALFALDSTRQGLAAAEESYRVRRELFRSGKATMIEVTDSETDLTRARLEVVNAHVDLRV
ncbi:MAG TPA: TolC family protein, partial [Polyangiaceae bacterium]